MRINKNYKNRNNLQKNLKNGKSKMSTLIRNYKEIDEFQKQDDQLESK